MEQRWTIRAGAVLILFAVLWKFSADGLPPSVQAFLQSPDTAAFLLYLETGRKLTLPQSTDPSEPETQYVVEATEPATTSPAGSITLGEGDAQYLTLHNTSGKNVDIAAMLCQSLAWDLTDGAPAVLILHTHATESYTRTTEAYAETTQYRTLNEDYNMVRIGEYLTSLLEAQGIHVIHDRTLHDHPTYTGAYTNSRAAAKAYLEKYPSIRLVLDLHRDAVEYPNGLQMATSATVQGKDSAQLMLVVGIGGQSQSHWQSNLSLAIKLHAILEQNDPGVTRPLYLRSERFNQDLLAGYLLIEVGAAGNTLTDALTATGALAEAIAQLAFGANTA